VTGIDLAALLQQSGFDRISILKINIGKAELAVFGSNYQPWISKVDNIAVELHSDEGRAALLGAIAAEGFVVETKDDVTYCRRLQPSRSPS
jgi:hypothetical protein